MQERSFSGKIFRPKPELLLDSDSRLLIVATPWGQRNSSRKLIESIQDYLTSSRQDNEATSPFQKMTCLSPTGNTLRVSVMLANDATYREDNKNEYLAGNELTVILKSPYECVWVQIGQPQIFLDRRQDQLILLSGNSDLSTHTSATTHLPPLPSELLGLYSTSNFSIHSFKPKPGDRLILLSRSIVPPEFMQLPKENRNLDDMSEVLAKNEPDMPFWLGILSLDD